MKVPNFLEGILDVDRMADVPLSQQVYRALREAAGNGVLKPGMRLPSSRVLAVQHGLSRNTVNTAYDLLKAEGIIETRAGAAPVVADVLPPEAARPDAPQSSAGPQLSDRGRLLAENLRGGDWGREPGALQPGAPALDCFPYELWARSLRRAARSHRSGDLLYQNTAGHPALKTVLADYLGSQRSVRTKPDQVLITTTMQSALSVLSSALSNPGDTAWIEDPGYMGARTAFYGAGLAIRGMPLDQHGPNPESLLGRSANPRLIYVTPSHQYPFGSRMSLARRLSLIETAAAVGATVLEDDYDSEFLFEGRPIAALQGLADASQVVYLGTFSKSFLPGVRLAYMVVSEGLAQPMADILRNTGRLANIHAQIALADFIQSGHYRAHLKRIRQIYQQRGLALVQTFKQVLGNAIAVDPPTGNVQVTITFSEDVDDRQIATKMQAKGYSVSPLSVCYLETPPKPGLIIGFAGAADHEISGGAEALKETLKAL